MSVLIHNMSEHFDIKYGVGEQRYVLCINKQVKAEFTHYFEDGLATCLRKAADALDKNELDVSLYEWSLGTAG